MAAPAVQSRILAAFAGDPRDVEWFLAAVRENQRLMTRRFERMAWLMLVFVLLFEMLIGESVKKITILGVDVPPGPVREALPAAIGAIYLALVVIGLIRLRYSEVHDLALARYRPQVLRNRLVSYVDPASLLQGSVLYDGIRSGGWLRALVASGPAAMVVATLVGPPIYVASALMRCFERYEDTEPSSLLRVSAVLAVVFCSYAVLLFLAQRPKQVAADAGDG